MNSEAHLHETYGDLLGDGADAGLLDVVRVLHGSYTAAAPTQSADVIMQRAVSDHAKRSLRHGLGRSVVRWWPQRTGLAVALLLAFVIAATGGVYAIGSLVDQTLGLDPGTK